MTSIHSRDLPNGTLKYSICVYKHFYILTTLWLMISCHTIRYISDTSPAIHIFYQNELKNSLKMC